MVETCHALFLRLYNPCLYPEKILFIFSLRDNPVPFHSIFIARN